MLIEISTSREAKKIIEKAKQVMEQYNIFESFIYDYEKKRWTKLTGIAQPNTLNSFSDILKIDLNSFV